MNKERRKRGSLTGTAIERERSKVSPVKRTKLKAGGKKKIKIGRRRGRVTGSMPNWGPGENEGDTLGPYTRGIKKEVQSNHGEVGWDAEPSMQTKEGGLRREKPGRISEVNGKGWIRDGAGKREKGRGKTT